MAPKKTLGDVHDRHLLRSIELRWFYRVLELTLLKQRDRTKDPFNIPGTLRDNGLKLTAAPEGHIGSTHPIEHGDISTALAKARRDYSKFEDDKFESESPASIPNEHPREAEIWSHEVPVCPGDPSHEYRCPIGGLWVQEDNYAEICQRSGVNTYYWPKVAWPQHQRDLEERDCATGEPLCDDDEAQVLLERVRAEAEARESTWMEQVAENRSAHELAQWRACGLPEYLPLKRAVCLVCDVSSAAVNNDKNPARMLWLKSLSAKQRDWQVRELKRADIEETVVRVADFIEWAWGNGFKAPEEVLQQIPDAEFGIAFKQTVRLGEIEHRIEEVEGARASTIGELRDKERWLAELRKEQQEIKNWLNNPRQDEQLDSDGQSQPCSDEMGTSETIHDWRDDPSLLKGAKQEMAISEAIKAKRWDPLKIPDGEKGTLKLLCEAEYPELFAADSAFEEAWRRGRKKEKWRMQSHSSYAKRGTA